MKKEDLPFDRNVEITQQDHDDLVAALKSAYPNQAFLYLRIANKMGVVVDDDIMSINNPGKLIRNQIVTFAESQGKFLELLAATWTDVPGNPDLKALADKFFPDKASVIAWFAPPALSAAAVIAAAAAPRPSLEKLIDKRSRRANLATYVGGLKRLSGAVCTVGIPELEGTGFLVGKRTVLTNFHVVKKAISGSYAGDKIICTFDHDRDDAPTVAFQGAVAWLRSKSPYSQSDLTGEGAPGPDELDYALITLAQDVEPTRLPLDWPIAPPIVSQRDFLVIGQHPRGLPTEIAFGEVVELPEPGLRYRYDVTTEPGSSGSPVLSVDLELVGLHHAADPQNTPRYNQAIPIARIMSRLKDEGIDLASL